MERVTDGEIASAQCGELVAVCTATRHLVRVRVWVEGEGWG